MRCKAGDLAVIVKCKADDAKHHVGKIVRCLRLVPTIEGFHGWFTEPLMYTNLGRGIAWCDDVLQPIDNPDDDAQDETLSWLPVPETTPAMLDREVEHG